MPANERGQNGPGTSAGRVTFLEGRGELPMVEITTPSSTAEVYLHGAHVTHFRKGDEPPLLFLSQVSRFDDGHPIRGGIPVIFPWFGSREGLGQHGFARVKTWELKEVVPAADGSVSIRFRLPDCPEASTLPRFTAEYVVTIAQSLTLQLCVTNNSQSDPFTFENCLHTYFAVGNIAAVSIKGLKGVTYADRVGPPEQRTETDDVIRIGSEVDRIYMNTMAPVEIHDPSLGRRILVETQGAHSTVVWNPWIAKAQQMPDFGNDEYERMVCVESGNVSANGIRLSAGETATLTVKLSTAALA